MTPTIEHLRKHKAAIDQAAQLYGASDVRVFGSVAGGTAKEGSDVNVLIKMERGRTLLDLVGFEQALEDELGLSVDVVEEGGIHPMLEPTIIAEALVL